MMVAMMVIMYLLVAFGVYFVNDLGSSINSTFLDDADKQSWTSNTVQFQDESVVSLLLRMLIMIMFLLSHQSLLSAFTFISFRYLESHKVNISLKANATYVFKVTYSADFATLPSCKTWNLEFEIAPISSSTPSTIDCTESLPETTIYVPTTQILEKEQQYAFRQTNKSFSHKLRFDITTFTYMRAILFYDFVWSDLTLRLTSNDTLVAFGINQYNENEISGVALQPGSYVLEIFESQPLEQEELRRCTEFTFSYGFAPMKDPSRTSTSSTTYTGCSDLYFPPRLDAIFGFSDLSGQQLHMTRDVLMNVDDKKHTSEFTIKQTSYFRVLVPPHKVDIDLTLEKKVVDDYTSIARSWGYAEESIFTTLTEGDYRLKLMYRPNYKNDFYFPDKDDCISFPIELSITPVTYADTSLVDSSSACVEPTLPVKMEPNVLYQQNFARPLSTKSYSVKLTVLEAGLFQSYINYVFPLGGLYVELVGTNIFSQYLSAPANRTYYANIGTGYAFFDEVLYPGDYELVFSDKGNYSSFSPQKCTIFSLGYQYQPTVIPNNYCDDADRLPTDLYSEKGGSKPFGGLQNPDGSVHISGSHFLMPEKNSHSNILFKVKSKSWVRFWASSEGAKNDVDFLLWKNSNKTQLVEAAVGLQSVESHISVLEPQDDDYLLDFYVFDRSEEDCTYVSFEFAVEPNSTVQSRRACPNPLPNPVLPPQTITLTEGFVDIFSPNFVFTKQYIDAHAVDHFSYKTVEYKINIVSNGNHSLYVMVGYDFVLTDFSIRLLKNEQVVITGEYHGNRFTGTDIDFLTTFSMDVQNGNYTLVIEEKIYSARGDMQAGECDKFSFMLLSSYLGGGDSGNNNTNGGDAPFVEYVSPPMAEQHDPSSSLGISVAFSSPIGSGIPSSYSALTAWIKNNSAVYLTEQETQRTIFPSISMFNSRRTELTVYFSTLKPAQSYALHLQSENFYNESGTRFQAHTVAHTYSTIDCACGGHGECQVNATHIRDCQCTFPYAGSECKSCITGFHRAGTDCVRNTKCTTNTCNGHGQCDDSQGYPVCECDEGFDSSSTEFCNKCSSGYENYPNCTEVVQKSARCTAPLLPKDLDSTAYLGLTGSVHLQNDYYIDQDHSTHEMSFSLKTDSYFRVYVEPHDIDIDVWLWQMPDNQTGGKYVGRTLIGNGISTNLEESLFFKLSGGKKYLLSFQYIQLWATSTGKCETFNMELAIAPVTEFTSELSRYTECKQNSYLPSLSPGTIPEQGYYYNASTVYSLVSTPTKNNSNVVFQFDFTISSIAHRVGLIEAEIEHRFLQGNLAIKVQRKSDTKDVVYGFNDYNKHHLQRSFYPGSYTLMVYLPLVQSYDVTPCIPFNFKFKASYTADQNNIFTCDHPALPSTLDSVIYDGDHIHIFDSFLVSEADRSITFTVNKSSSIRVSASSKTSFVLVLEEKRGSDYETISVNTLDGQIFNGSLVAKVEYRIYIFYSVWLASDDFCLTLDLELEIIPNLLVTEYQRQYSCPVGGLSRVPTIPSRFASLPYKHHPESVYPQPETLYYALSTFGKDIAVYNFTVTENVLIEVGVSSHFLMGNLKLKLEGSKEVVKSVSSQENYNYIVDELEPGTYTLTIVNYLAAPTSLVACVPFGFDMNVYKLSAYKASDCSNVDRLELPKSLNSLRYLSSDNEITLQSNKWAVPKLNLSHAERTISVNLTVNSYIRVYVEPHEVDIDIHLYLVGNENYIATGENLFGEESFVKFVEKGNYLLRFDFFNWKLEEPTCDSFAMEIAIAPAASLPVRSNCPENHKEVWPNFKDDFKASDLPYTYNDKSNTFHYQQTDHNERRKPIQVWPINIHTPVDFHAEIGYNFLTGDLVLKLEGSGPEPILGKNEYSRNVLSVRNLAAGTYNLTVYESSGNDQKLAACSYFTFSMFVDAIQETSFESNEHPLLTSSLNSVSFLKYSDEVHIQNEYRVLINPPLETVKGVAFHLNKESLVRVSVEYNAPLTISLNSPTSEDTTRSFARKLAPGDYTIYFIMTEDRWSEYLTSDVEFAIMPVEKVNSIISTMGCRTNSPWIDQPQIVPRPSDSYYQYKSSGAFLSSSLVSNTEVFKYDFVVTTESLVAVELRYNFLFTHLSAKVVQKIISPFFVDVPRYGSQEYNMNDLNVIINPGAYQLVIYQQKPWNATDVVIPCADIDLRITIAKADANADRVDCSSLAVFPWDLNSNTGGSVQYGGPLRYNVLNMFHDKFLLNSASKSLKSKFHVTDPVLVSILVDESSWSDLKFQLTKNTSTISPIYSATALFQTVALYELPALSISEDYSVDLTYRPNRFVSCSQFAYGMVVKPTVDVGASLQASCVGTHELPPKSTNNSFVLTSYFTNQDLTQNTVGTTFSYTIDFSITSATYVDISMSYNALSSFFTLKLKKTNLNGDWRDAESGKWDTTTASDKSFLGSTQQINYNAQPGSYRLVISQPKLNLPFYQEGYCHPFELNFQLQSAAAGPIVRYVEPPSGDNFDPNLDLSIEVRFSEALYDSDGVAITRTRGFDLVLRSISLKDLNETGTKIYADQASRPVSTSSQDDLLRWSFLFSHGNFKYGHTYVLNLEPIVYNKNNQVLGGSFSRHYTMEFFDETCSGFGEYFASNQSCVCDVNAHRTGKECDVCVSGYVFDVFKNCVREPVCGPRTCGCTGSFNCAPIGNCSEVDGKAVCSCPKNFGGERCNQCATGYVNYPLCTPAVTGSCPLGCIHGTCSEATSTCICQGNWQGSACDICPTGYSGENCDAEYGTIGIAAAVVAIVLVAGVAAVFWWLKTRSGGGLIGPYSTVGGGGMDLELEGGTRFAGGDEKQVPLSKDSDEELGGSDEEAQELDVDEDN
eukprot:TRINITY_DN351_c0_g2_i3.p1 TRINITY_DN351_c0_g2~~TRINITY_DN351_c0_g2_i3.p1  ORF type:complete len:2844 (-),score=811.49 TRINITY_DN351_c0_g2_i3:165-8696(-)